MARILRTFLFFFTLVIREICRTCLRMRSSKVAAGSFVASLERLRQPRIARDRAMWMPELLQRPRWRPQAS